MNRHRIPTEESDLSPAPRGTGCCSDYVLAPLFVLAIVAAALVTAYRSARASDDPPGLARLSLPQGAASQIAGVFTPEVQHWGGAITTWALEAGLDPNLAATVMQIESCGDPRALSRSGAIGLFQVMPYHFAAAEAPYTPDTNAARGLNYLARALAAADGDARLAFAGYNGGTGVISRPEWSWPDETVRYAYWGSGIYADASRGAITSPRLDEWLNAGGWSLCRRAHEHLGLED